MRREHPIPIRVQDSKNWGGPSCNPAKRGAPQTPPQELLALAGILNFSCGKMRFPARVRVPWKGRGGTLFTQRRFPQSYRFESAFVLPVSRLRDKLPGAGACLTESSCRGNTAKNGFDFLAKTATFVRIAKKTRAVPRGMNE